MYRDRHRSGERKKGAQSRVRRYLKGHRRVYRLSIGYLLQPPFVLPARRRLLLAEKKQADDHARTISLRVIYKPMIIYLSSFSRRLLIAVFRRFSRTRFANAVRLRARVLLPLSSWHIKVAAVQTYRFANRVTMRRLNCTAIKFNNVSRRNLSFERFSRKSSFLNTTSSWIMISTLVKRKKIPFSLSDTTQNFSIRSKIPDNT